jgi:CRP-like cAMP-binding protein
LIDFIQKLKGKIALSTKAEAHFYSIAKELQLKKGAVLIREGQIVQKVYFVTAGCLRSYCTDKNGKEHTLLFAIKDWWISDYIAVHTNEKATLNIECLTDATVIEFDAKAIDDMLTLFPELEQFQRHNLERHVVSLQKRILNQLQLSASERYAVFVKKYPDIEQHTRNYHIASFLGITQESLSRIRVERTKKVLS